MYMKTILKYFWRDKVDLMMFIFMILAFAQLFFFGKDLTAGFSVMILYVFGTIYRLGLFQDIIMKQDQEIKDLNEQIQSKNDQITELIKKYNP